MEHQNIIIITAGRGSWLRETFDPRSWVRMMGEGLVSDYQNKMQVLRQIDDRIYDWTKDLNSLVKEAEKALTARRLLDLALILNNINSKMSHIEVAGREVEKVTEEALNQFEMRRQAGYFSDLKRRWVAEKLETQWRKERDAALRSLVSATKVVVTQVLAKLKEMGKARAYGNIGEYIDGIKQIAAWQKRYEYSFSSVFNKYLQPLINSYQEELKQQEMAQQAGQVSDLTAPETPPPNPAIPLKSEVPSKLPAVPSLVIPPPLPSTESISPLPSSKEQPSAPAPSPPDLPSKSTVEPEIIRIKSPKNLGTQVIPSEEENIPDIPLAEPFEENVEEFAELIPVSDNPEVEKKPEISGEVVPLPSPEKSKSHRVIKKHKTAQHYQFLQELHAIAETKNPKLLVTALLNYAEKIEDSDPVNCIKLMTLAEGLLDD